MNAIRRLMCLLIWGLGSAFALTSLAASDNSLYTVTMTVLTPPPAIPGSAPTQLKAVIKNVSPSGSNATFNSIDLFVDVNWTIDQTQSNTAVESNQATVYTPDLSTPGHLKFGNLYPVKRGQSLIVTFYVTSSACGDANWDAIVYPGGNFGGGNPFTKPKPDPSAPLTPVACGNVACTGVTSSFTAPLGCVGAVGATDPDCLTGVRGAFNSNGSTCGSVYFFATNTLLDNLKLHFRWQTDVLQGGQPTAGFAYKTNVEAAGSPSWQVAWLPKPGVPVYISAPQCAVQSVNPPSDLPMPAPYGTLSAKVKLAVAGTIDKISVQASAATPSIEFSIVVDSETMRVTNINGNSWTVVRGYGTPTDAHLAGAFVMSTPLLPLSVDYNGVAYAFANGSPEQVAGYAVGKQAQMCLASTPVDNGDGTWSAWFIDLSDGYVKGSI